VTADWMPSHHRGHAIEDRGGTWVYSSDGTHVASDPDRACGHCGLPNTPDGCDACLGTLPGVRNACCGHGNIAAAYVQLWTGETTRGKTAAEMKAGV